MMMKVIHRTKNFLAFIQKYIECYIVDYILRLFSSPVIVLAQRFRIFFGWKIDHIE